MRPYYEQDGIVIYHGDCREILPKINVGLMVTDPPYNVGYHYDEHDDRMSYGDYWEMLRSVLSMPLVFIHYPETMYEVSKKFRRAPDEVVAWVYHANTPKQWRMVAWFGTKPDFTLDGQDYRNPTDKRVKKLIESGKRARLYDWWHIEQVKNVSTEKTDHPCQIPLSLIRRVLTVTPPQEPVVDPFCGSGTTLLAAQKLGLRAVGIERSEKYCEISAGRLSQSMLPITREVRV